MRKSVLKTITIALLSLLSGNILYAQQEDAEGCKDHPFVSRMPGFYLSRCEESYNQVDIITGVDKTTQLEGTVINYEYYIKEGAKVPSRFQIIKNYENAILAKGGEKIYSKFKDAGEGTIAATFRMKSDGVIYWLSFTYFNGSETQSDGYFLSVVKEEAMKQEVTANEMFEKINSGSSLTLYINFETGKSSIKNESQNIVDELYNMLKENPTLKVLIEGHTDNVGNKATNQTLSEQRAASLKQALVSKGIAADRIKSTGFGQDKPVADNSTEDGKAQNRRVEIKRV